GRKGDAASQPFRAGFRPISQPSLTASRTWLSIRTMTTLIRRCALVLLVAGLAAAPPALARGRVRILKFPKIEVPPRSDSEKCIFVRIPRSTPIDTGGTEIINKGVKPGFVSHHFLMWAYQGTQADGFPTDATPVPGEACLDFGPSDRDQRVLVAGS